MIVYDASVERDFATESSVLEDELVTGVRWQAVEGLRALEEDWARDLLDLGEGPIEALVRARVQASLAAEVAEQAERHLAAAERWQWEIGGYATGAGEGLASMTNVYRLKLAQAWLAGALAQLTSDPAHAMRAETLVAAIEHAPSARGAVHADAIAQLRAWLPV